MTQASTDPVFPTADRQKLVAQLLRIVPPDAVLHQQEDLSPYECDGLSAYRQRPLVDDGSHCTYGLIDAGSEHYRR